MAIKMIDVYFIPDINCYDPSCDVSDIDQITEFAHNFLSFPSIDFRRN